MKRLDEKTAAYRAACTALVIAQGKEESLRERLNQQAVDVANCKEAMKAAERALLEEARAEA